MDEQGQVIEELKAIRRGQELLLEGQQKSLQMQEDQYKMAKRQFERAEKLQDRAEELQVSGARMMGTARKALVVVLPIIFVLLVYLSWLIFR